MLIAQADLEEMVSYRKNVTGVDHTIFISPKGNARHSPRIKIAIDPPDSLDPRSKTAAIDLEGKVVAGTRNRRVLMDYWMYRIDTSELQQRLRRD
jgi:hypothetical protein